MRQRFGKRDLAGLGQHDGLVAGKVRGGEDVGDQRGIVGRQHAQRIARLVLQVGAGEREAEMHRLLAGTLARQHTLLDQRREERIVAAIHAGRFRGGRRQGRKRGCGSFSLGLARRLQPGQQRGLPALEGFVDLDVGGDGSGHAPRAQRLEPLVEVGAELAEVLVVAVAQGEHGVFEALQTRRGRGRKRVEEALHAVRRIAFAIRAGHDYRALLDRKFMHRIGVERGQLGGVTLRFQLLGDLLRQPLAGAGLRGIEHGHVARLEARLRGSGRRRSARIQAGQEAVEPGPLRRIERRGIRNKRHRRHG